MPPILRLCHLMPFSICCSYGERKRIWRWKLHVICLRELCAASSHDSRLIPDAEPFQRFCLCKSRRKCFFGVFVPGSNFCEKIRVVESGLFVSKRCWCFNSIIFANPKSDQATHPIPLCFFFPIFENQKLHYLCHQCSKDQQIEKLLHRLSLFSFWRVCHCSVLLTDRSADASSPGLKKSPPQAWLRKKIWIHTMSGISKKTRSHPAGVWGQSNRTQIFDWNLNANRRTASENFEIGTSVFPERKIYCWQDNVASGTWVKEKRVRNLCVEGLDCTWRIRIGSEVTQPSAACVTQAQLLT